MKIKHKLLATAVSACLLFNTAGAISNIGIQFPLGIPLNPATGSAVNMGGSAAGIINANNVLSSNPASLGPINKIAFSSLFTFEGLIIKDGSHHSNHIDAAPRQLSFAFPLGTLGTVGVAISKETDCALKYRSDEQTLANQTGQASPLSMFSGRLAFDQEGGMAGWRIGWGKSIGKWAHAGAAYERIQFTRNSTRIVELPLFPLNSSRDSTNITFVANALHLGTIIPVGKLGIGLAGRYVFETDIEYYRGLYNGISRTVTNGTDSSVSARVQLPPYAVLGLSYEFSPGLLVGTDMKVTAWNEYFSGGLLPSANLEYAMSFSAGIRYIVSPDVLAPKYWETIQYRAGVNIQQLPAPDVSEVSLSLGAGFPLKGGGLVDLILSGGMRSDPAFADYAEEFVQLSIGINGGRKWIKTASDTY